MMRSVSMSSPRSGMTRPSTRSMRTTALMPGLPRAAPRRLPARTCGCPRPAPATAAAATIAGLISSVRPVGLPWRPLKLRLDDDALISRPCSLSGFMPRHIEHPEPRQSNPASMKISCRPSASACGAHGLRSRHDHRPHRPRHLLAADETRGFPQIGQARVGARADERDVDRRALDRLPRREAHELQRLFDERPILGRHLAWRRHAFVHAYRLARVQPPRDDRAQRVGTQLHVVVVASRRRRSRSSATSPSLARRPRPVARTAGPPCRQRSSRPDSRTRRARRPRWTCCTSSCARPSTSRRRPIRRTRTRNRRRPSRRAPG